MNRHLLLGLFLFPYFVIGLLVWRLREDAPPPSGLACYANVHPTANDRDTVWVCFRVRP
jgi:hypothetical protein